MTSASPLQRGVTLPPAAGSGNECRHACRAGGGNRLCWGRALLLKCQSKTCPSPMLLLCRLHGGSELCSRPAGREVHLCSRACLLSLCVHLSPATGTIRPGAALIKTPFCRGQLLRPIKRMELHPQLCPADHAGEAACNSASSFASVRSLP